MSADLSMRRMLEVARSGAPAVWVRVEQSRGSAPRDAGASMLVGVESLDGTIGGGHLEYQAIAIARAMLRDDQAMRRRDGVKRDDPGMLRADCAFRRDDGAMQRPARAQPRELALGPALGQCCGGSVRLMFRLVDEAEVEWVERLALAERVSSSVTLRTTLAPDQVPHSRVASLDQRDAETGDIDSRLHFDRWQVWVFGAGHVGEAVVRILATLPASIVWIDPRESQFPALLPDAVIRCASDSPVHEVASIPSGADVLVMTHSHAIDLELCAALAARDDLGWCGVIGSRTKARRFAARLAARGVDAARIARLHCPIGHSMASHFAATSRARADAKHPGAIALDVVFQLWQRRLGDETPTASSEAALPHQPISSRDGSSTPDPR